AYILSVLSTGYEPKELRVKVLPEQTSTIDIALTVEVTELNEVVILGENAEVQQLLLSAKAIAVIDTEQAKIQTIDLGEVLTRTQGVNVQRSGGLGSNAQLSLNGLTNDQIRFFVDGVPLRSMGYVFGLANVPVNLVDRVEVYKGVVPVRFGADALGGAVNLVSNQAFEGTGGTISYQVGSFNTHRLAFNGYHQPQNGNYFIKASGFYDYTQNNYDIDVEVPDARGKLTEQTIERFHDDYLARGLNVDFGLRNLTWADELMIKGFMSDGERDLQHNFIMSIPYGEVTTDYASLGGLLRWRKNFGQGLSIENVAGLSENQTELLDTASFVYTWEGTPSVNLDGDIILRDPPGERGVPSDIQFVDRTYYNRFNLDLRLGNYHQLRFSSSPTFDSRSGRNFLITDPETVDRFTLRNEILTFTNGVEYEYKRSDKINIIAFFKSYTQNLNTQDIENGGLLTDVERRTNDLGYGANLKYSVSNRLELKTSYEWATRLPNVQEVFGDGVFISDNVDLEPERSHNINLALNYKTRFFGNSNIGLGVNGFVRDVRNLIVLLGADEVFVYQNVADASSRGVELNMSWSSYDRNINFVANSTYFDFVNTAESGPFAAFNGDRIPNRPYLFFNSSLRYRFDQLFEDPNDLIVFAGSRYVHDFFRSWESAGRQDTKQVIPGQFTQNIGVTHNRSFSNKRLALTLEVQNLTDAKVFDLFGVQRPGREYYFKTIFTF
ncbi:MAG: TonB-dependent receptor, partial [Bacteroidota bacterium]